MTDDTWGQVREELLKAVGKNNFSAWIAPIAFDRMDGRTAMFHVPTTFFGSWVSQNYGDVIRRTLASNGVGADRVEFHVGPSEPVQAGNGAGVPAAKTEPRSTELEAAVAAAPVLARSAAAHPVAGAVADLRAPQHDPIDKPRAMPSPNRSEVFTFEFTFENFVVGKPNELAHAAARRVAEGRDGDVQPAVPLWRRGPGQDAPDARHRVGASGEFPRGRRSSISRPSSSCTASSARCANRTRSASSRCSARRRADGRRRAVHRRQGLHAGGILPHLQRAGGWASRSSSPPTARPGDGEAGGRIKSRLQCGLVVDIHPTDYELRLGILQHKASACASAPPREIADGVLEFIAQDLVQCPRAGRRADPAFRASPIWSEGHHDGTGAGLPGRHPASTPTAR
jgi:chromosomal replication initiator protein